MPFVLFWANLSTPQPTSGDLIRKILTQKYLLRKFCYMYNWNLKNPTIFKPVKVSKPLVFTVLDWKSLVEVGFCFKKVRYDTKLEIVHPFRAKFEDPFPTYNDKKEILNYDSLWDSTHVKWDEFYVQTKQSFFACLYKYVAAIIAKKRKKTSCYATKFHLIYVQRILSRRILTSLNSKPCPSK